MKKILFALSCLFSLVVCAQEPAKYLRGGIPEVNGIVTFTHTIALNDAQKALPLVSSVIKEKLVDPAIKDHRTRLIADGSDGTAVVARVEEEMVFKRKPLYLDKTNFRYQISVEPKENELLVTITQVNYYYNDGPNGEFNTIKAEGWITDKDAVNKKNTKLLPRSGKFRRKTIDRVEEIFNLLDTCLKN